MAQQNIVRMNEISDCVAQTIANIHAGVAAARQAGVQAELPTEVAFEMIVIKDWQLLSIHNAESGTTTETQGGETQEGRVSGSTETQDRDEGSHKTEVLNKDDLDVTLEVKSGTRSDQKTNNNAHNESNEESYTYT